MTNQSLLFGDQVNLGNAPTEYSTFFWSVEKQVLYSFNSTNSYLRSECK